MSTEMINGGCECSPRITARSKQIRTIGPAEEDCNDIDLLETPEAYTYKNDCCQIDIDLNLLSVFKLGRNSLMRLVIVVSENLSTLAIIPDWLIVRPGKTDGGTFRR